MRTNSLCITVLPENIHTHSVEVIGKFQGGSGLQKVDGNFQESCMRINWNSSRMEVLKPKNTSYSRLRIILSDEVGLDITVLLCEL